MIATILLGIVIAVATVTILYRQLTGKDKHCDECNSGCPVKHAQENNQQK